ncbi:polymorphic toxin type 46 domain-containing protein [Paraburkholderia sp. MM5482-R1]|uniref:polymorphic toxin type 46 domain-containing protein n=1 Tax=unclassified Paraburkholderia TaxID=2615204 RepID=UPI003D236822
MDAIASTIGNLVVDNVQAASVGKTDFTKQAIDAMNGEILPGGLGGVGSGFVAPEMPYSNNAALFGVGGLPGALGGLTSAGARSAYASSEVVAPYSGGAVLYGPNLGGSIVGPLGQGSGFGYVTASVGSEGRSPRSVQVAGGDADALLDAWDLAKQTAVQGGKGLAKLGKSVINGVNANVNGAFQFGHAVLAAGEEIGLLPPGASNVSTPHVPLFDVPRTTANQAGAAFGFVGTMLFGGPETAPAAAPSQSVAASINSGSNAIRETVLANVAESQAARASSQFDGLARYDKAYSFYSEAGFSAERTLGHLQGIDFAQPVSVVRLESRNYVQYVPNGRIGNYFAPVDTQATMLGINPAGRTPILFAPTQPVMALQSTAVRIVDTWTVPSTPFNAAGGGTQFFVPNKQFMRQVP